MTLRHTTIFLAVLTSLAASGAHAASWGPFNAEFPAASDGIAKQQQKSKDGRALFANGQGFSIGGWFKPAELSAAPTLLAGVNGAGYLCSIDGKAAFCTEGASVVSSTALPADTWTHLVASHDGRKLTLYVNGRVAAQQDVAIGTPVAEISIAPRGKTSGAFAGRVAGLTVSDDVFDQAVAARMAAVVPNENLINFETGSPHWPVQTRQMAGQTAPQDAWTLPRSSTPPSAPVAKPAYSGPALEKSGVNEWKIRAWSLQAAPEVTAPDQQVASGGFDAKGWHRATVPGTVLTTLVDRGVYPDPAYGLNNLAIPESLNKQDYWYRSSFDTPKGFKPGQHLFVTFKGVNYAAAVWVNGRRVGDMKGAFIRGSFDISPYLNAKGQNVIAVKVSPPPHPGIPQEESLTAGAGENGGVLAQDGPTFIATEGWDWIPSVRDRNTGIWQDVVLRATHDLRLGDAYVITALTKADNSEADVSVDVPVTNLAGKAVRATVRATITDRVGTLKPVVVSKTVTLAPGEQTVRFNAREFAALKIRQPRLWWPNGYGRPDMHDVRVDVLQGSELSDQSRTGFGIRAVTYELSLVDATGHLHRVEADFTKARELGIRITDGRHEAIRKIAGNQWATGLRTEAIGTPAIRELGETSLTPHLVVKVNGVRIAARGGNWGMDDFMKRVDRQRLEPYFRLHRDANVNIIRNWVGQNTEEAFFELADEYGLMVLNDFWASTQDYNIEPQDVNLFMTNARDTVKRFRNHPSVIAWFGRNEGVPQPALNEALESLIYELDGTRWYTGSSNRVNLQNSGPYNYQAPATYFTQHAKGFSVEVGVPSMPTIESIKAAIPEPERWPISDSVAYHDWHPDGNGGTGPFMQALRTSYGDPASLDDFERKAQLMNYDIHRAIFEGMNAGLWRENSGRMLWMTQPAWPSTMWQILSHDYDTHGSFYGVKGAAEPVHVQMNLPDYRAMVINNPAKPLQDLTVSYQAYGMDGKLLGSSSAKVNVDAVQTSAPLDLGIGKVVETNGAAIVKLALKSGGATLSENVYWPSATPEGQQALNKLAPVPVGLTVSRHPNGAEQRLNITLANSSAVPVLNSKLTLFTAAGERVLPVYYSHNYVSLMPGESKTLTADFKAQGPLTLSLRGWNAQAQSVQVPDLAPPACATHAAPRTAEYPWMSTARWKQMHADQVAIARKGGVDVMFVGDSITEGWPQPIWDKAFGDMRPANFGIGGDHTGNVLWRLQDAHIAALKPRAVVLLIGTNNFGLCDESPEQVFAGIKAVVDKLRATYPQARILLNAVLPAGETAKEDRRARIDAVNKMVARLADGKQVVLRNYGPRLTRPDGSISPEIMPDFLHLTPKGYQIWADALRPDLQQLLK
ncbi:MAG: glycosyl hydrolase 2 galactose-binding domain-containing protein [Gammaproteobacteria bacterium]